MRPFPARAAAPGGASVGSLDRRGRADGRAHGRAVGRDRLGALRADLRRAGARLRRRGQAGQSDALRLARTSGNEPAGPADQDLGRVLGLQRRLARIARGCAQRTLRAGDQPDQDRVAPAPGPPGSLHVLRRPPRAGGRAARRGGPRGTGGACGDSASARLLPGANAGLTTARPDARAARGRRPARYTRPKVSVGAVGVGAAGAGGAPAPIPALPRNRPGQRGTGSGRVLVLNASYEPINVCTVRRATVLVLKQRAEILERSEWSMRAE